MDVTMGMHGFYVLTKRKNREGHMRFKRLARWPKTRVRMGALFFSNFTKKQNLHGMMRFSGFPRGLKNARQNGCIFFFEFYEKKKTAWYDAILSGISSCE